MIIKAAEMLGSVKLYNEKGAASRKVEGTAYKNSRLQPDEVILSGQSSGLSNVVKKVRETSDVRQEKVDELKTKVESGAYYVGAYDIASKMISAYKGGV